MHIHYILYLHLKLLKDDRVAFFSWYFYVSQWRICTFVGRCFSSVITKRRQSIITLPHYSTHPWLFLALISFSLCLLPCLPCSSHILYPPIPLVAAKALTDKLQGRQREKEMAREKEIERGSDIWKKRPWHQSTYFSLFAMFPIFAFFTTPLHFLAAPSACLAF